MWYGYHANYMTSTWWEWPRTVYIKWVDLLWNTWSDFSDSITVDTTTPSIWQAEIYSGTTWNIWATLYYKWTYSIRATATDSYIDPASCEYTTWWTVRAAATYSSPYCIKDNLPQWTDLTINFRARDLATNLWTWTSRSYTLDATAPTIIFTWSTPSAGSTGTWNSFTPQLQICLLYTSPSPRD